MGFMGGIASAILPDFYRQPAVRRPAQMHRALPPGAGARLQRVARARADARGGVRRARRGMAQAGHDAAAQLSPVQEVRAEGTAGAEGLSSCVSAMLASNLTPCQR